MDGIGPAPSGAVLGGAGVVPIPLPPFLSRYIMLMGWSEAAWWRFLGIRNSSQFVLNTKSIRYFLKPVDGSCAR